MGMGNEGREGVAVLLPAGNYRITNMIEIKQSNVVLRGEGVSPDSAGYAALISVQFCRCNSCCTTMWQSHINVLLCVNVPRGLLPCLPAGGHNDALFPQEPAERVRK
jgi:hypothetical protein